MITYERIYKKLLKLIPDLNELKLGDARKSKSPPYMDLNLDVLSVTDDKLIIALSHYYVSNGDLVPDPDMEIKVHKKHGFAEALSRQDAFFTQKVYKREGGKLKVSPKLKRELNLFLNNTWLKNCLAQDHRLTKETSQN